MQRDLHASIKIRGVIFEVVWVIESPENKDFRLRRDHLYPMQTFCVFACSDFGKWCVETCELRKETPVLRHKSCALSTAPPEDTGRAPCHFAATFRFVGRREKVPSVQQLLQCDKEQYE